MKFNRFQFFLITTLIEEDKFKASKQSHCLPRDGL